MIDIMTKVQPIVVFGGIKQLKRPEQKQLKMAESLFIIPFSA